MSYLTKTLHQTGKLEHETGKRCDRRRNLCRVLFALITFAAICLDLSAPPRSVSAQPPSSREERAVYLDERYYGHDQGKPLRPRPVRVAGGFSAQAEMPSTVEPLAEGRPSSSELRPVTSHQSHASRQPHPSHQAFPPTAEMVVPAGVHRPAPPHLILEPLPASSPRQPIVGGDPYGQAIYADEPLEHFPNQADVVAPPQRQASSAPPPLIPIDSQWIAETHSPGVANEPAAGGPGPLGLGSRLIRPGATPRPKIPAATVQPRWKPPYSYGYFGAEGKRHWYRQHGYRDRFIQWTLR